MFMNSSTINQLQSCLSSKSNSELPDPTSVAEDPTLARELMMERKFHHMKRRSQRETEFAEAVIDIAEAKSRPEAESEPKALLKSQPRQRRPVKSQPRQKRPPKYKSKRLPKLESRASPLPEPENKASPPPTPESKASPLPTPESKASPLPTPESKPSPLATPESNASPFPEPESKTGPPKPESRPSPPPGHESKANPLPKLESKVNPVPKSRPQRRDPVPKSKSRAKRPKSAPKSKANPKPAAAASDSKWKPIPEVSPQKPVPTTPPEVKPEPDSKAEFLRQLNLESKLRKKKPMSRRRRKPPQKRNRETAPDKKTTVITIPESVKISLREHLMKLEPGKAPTLRLLNNLKMVSGNIIPNLVASSENDRRQYAALVQMTNANKAKAIQAYQQNDTNVTGKAVRELLVQQDALRDDVKYQEPKHGRNESKMDTIPTKRRGGAPNTTIQNPIVPVDLKPKEHVEKEIGMVAQPDVGFLAEEDVPMDVESQESGTDDERVEMKEQQRPSAPESGIQIPVVPVNLKPQEDVEPEIGTGGQTDVDFVAEEDVLMDVENQESGTDDEMVEMKEQQRPSAPEKAMQTPVAPANWKPQKLIEKEIDTMTNANKAKAIQAYQNDTNVTGSAIRELLVEKDALRDDVKYQEPKQGRTEPNPGTMPTLQKGVQSPAMQIPQGFPKSVPQGSSAGGTMCQRGVQSPAMQIPQGFPKSEPQGSSAGGTMCQRGIQSPAMQIPQGYPKSEPQMWQRGIQSPAMQIPQGFPKFEPQGSSVGGTMCQRGVQSPAMHIPHGFPKYEPQGSSAGGTMCQRGIQSPAMKIPQGFPKSDPQGANAEANMVSPSPPRSNAMFLNTLFEQEQRAAAFKKAVSSSDETEDDGSD